MRNRLHNLNYALIPDDTDGPGVALIDPSAESASIRCYFRDIRDKFLSELHGADAIVGCVAWFTDTRIIQALSCLELVSLVVQKEDFLRPDCGKKADLRALYDQLRCPLERNRMPHPINELSTCADDDWHPVRCVGNHNSAKSPAHPRMHHKFVVFCRTDEIHNDDRGYERCRLLPYKVWTGSFNLTYVGSLSLENAVVITDRAIVDAYFSEWAQVSCLSEPLDWWSEWVAPEHRIVS